jgi:transposase
MRHYSQDLKETMVTKLCSPGGVSYSELARESGIATSTLHGWVKQLGVLDKMKKKKRSIDCSPVERLQLVFKSQNLGEKDYGEFLRLNGLHSHDIESWKSDVLTEIESIKPGRPKLDPELKSLRMENVTLKKDLLRKDKALAEAAALIILKKRAEELWGAGEEDE